jgi:hypothetical protein
MLEKTADYWYDRIEESMVDHDAETTEHKYVIDNAVASHGKIINYLYMHDKDLFFNTMKHIGVSPWFMGLPLRVDKVEAIEQNNILMGFLTQSEDIE